MVANFKPDRSRLDFDKSGIVLGIRLDDGWLMANVMNNDPRSKRDFPETRWSIVVNAADLKSPRRTEALESLVESYLPALKAHLILRRRLQPDVVEDFVQDFVLKKILEQNVVAKAESDRGRFRSFLLKSLDNFVRDYFRTNKVQEQLDSFAADMTEGERSDAADVFEAAWARQVFCNAVGRFKEDCDNAGNHSRWMLFQERLLVPVASREATDDYDQLAKKCNFESPKHARNAMVGAKRAFDKSIRSVIQDYVLDESQVDSELEDLVSILKNSNVLDEAIADFVQPQQSLRLSEATFQSIRITGLLEMNSEANIWTDADLSRMWLEILNTNFEQLKLADEFRKIEPARNPAKTRIEDVLFDPSPRLETLDILRGYAKAEYANAEHSEAGGSEGFPCYFVLYMTAIAAAIYKHQKTLSRLPVERLKKNFNWVLEFSWLDPKSHEYLQIAKRVV